MPDRPKRLLHFQTVGFSDEQALGAVSRNVVTPDRGWQTHVDRCLKSLVSRLGPGTFDWWGHNPGGVWFDTNVRYAPEILSKMRFDQLAIARQRYPKLVDYGPLAAFAAQHSIEQLAAAAQPRDAPAH